MFHAERLDRRHLWLACYLPGRGVEGDRITFEVSVGDDGELLFEVGEQPAGSVARE